MSCYVSWTLFDWPFDWPNLVKSKMTTGTFFTGTVTIKSLLFRTLYK